MESAKTPESAQNQPKTVKRPPFFRAWEALDVGFVDKTAWIAGYVDFAEGVLVVEDEFLLARATTTEIADAIERHERELWGPERFAGGFLQPNRRVSDIDHRLIADLRQAHRLDFAAIEKKNFAADIALVNMLIVGKQLLVSESCVHLRRQLASGKYNTTHKDMGRDTGGGHFDLLAALRYGCRVAEPLLRENPYPLDWKLPRDSQSIWRPPPPPERGLMPPNNPFAERVLARDARILGRWRRR